MNKIPSSLVVTLISLSFFLIACAPTSDFLSGTGGEGEENPPVEEPTEAPLIVEPTDASPVEEPTEAPVEESPLEDEPPVANPPPQEFAPTEPPPTEVPPSITANFLLPTLTIFVSNDGYTTGISAPPMGTAEYQLTAPNSMLEQREYLVKLILVPNKLPINKTEVFEEFEEGVTQGFQGEIDYFSQMNAEIITGTSFSVQPNSFLHKYINEEKSTTWLWYITGLQIGTHKISVVISTPVIANDVQENFELENIEFEVNVYSPQPANTPAAVNPAEPNTGASDTNIAVGTGSFMTAALEAFTAVVALITAIVGIGSVYNKIKKLILKNSSQSKDKAIGAVRIKDVEKKNNKPKK